jgi:hypothetical protein
MCVSLCQNRKMPTVFWSVVAILATTVVRVIHFIWTVFEFRLLLLRCQHQRVRRLLTNKWSSRPIFLVWVVVWSMALNSYAFVFYFCHGPSIFDSFCTLLGTIKLFDHLYEREPMLLAEELQKSLKQGSHRLHKGLHKIA